MGCCQDKGNVSDPARQQRTDEALARRMQQEEDRAGGQQPQRQQRGGENWGTAGGGTQLGGGNSGRELTPEEKRQAAVEAAERRQQNLPGLSQEKSMELIERQRKDELLGKLTEHYQKQKLEMPMGLNAASADQLKKHWDTVRQGDKTAAVLAS